jgi:hypothetical protein
VGKVSALKYLIITLLFLINNYIFYFNINIFTLVIFLAISAIIYYIFSINNVQTVINYFIFLIFFFPKKAINLEYANEYLSKCLLNIEYFDGISFFDFYLLPFVSFLLYLKYINNAKKNGIFFINNIFILSFFVGLILFYLLAPNLTNISKSQTRILVSLIYSLQILCIPAIIYFKDYINCTKNLFEKIIIYINIFLFLELILVFTKLLPPSILSQSIDYREGFRSVLFGYSIYVGFFALLGTFVSLLKIFKYKKKQYLLLIPITLFLQFAAFDRTPLLASILSILLFSFYHYRKVILIFIGIIGFILTISLNPILTYIQNSSISEVKTDGFFGTESTVGRFGIQLRYIDGAINNYFLPAGRKTHIDLYNAELPYLLKIKGFEINSISLQEAHNLFFQMFFELGIISFAIYMLYILYFLINKKLDIYYLIGFFGVCIYYLNQATPVYYFMPLLFIIYSLKPNIYE